MKGEDKEQLEGLLGIFTGYQTGAIIAIVLIILLLTLFMFPGVALVLLTLFIVLLLPYLFTRKSNKNEK